VLKPENGFDPVVEMWVFEEYVKFEGGKWERPARGAKPPEGKTWVDEGYSPLTQVINEKHENIIYLPDIPLPVSIHANPDIKSTVTGATMMIFVIPHNFLAPLVPKLQGAFAPGCIGISLIKGIEFSDTTSFLKLRVKFTSTLSAFSKFKLLISTFRCSLLFNELITLLESL
jgi:hypothetical protein